MKQNAGEASRQNDVLLIDVLDEPTDQSARTGRGPLLDRIMIGGLGVVLTGTTAGWCFLLVWGVGWIIGDLGHLWPERGQ